MEQQSIRFVVGDRLTGCLLRNIESCRRK